MATKVEVDVPRRPSKGDLRRYVLPNRPVDTLAGKQDEDERRSTPDDLIPPERATITKAEIEHLSGILQELNSLRTGPEQDEHGVLRPTRDAYEMASGLLVDAAIVASRKTRKIPLGAVSTDSEGGVRIEWVRPDRSVHLVVPSARENPSYIYHECGDDFDTEDASADRLAHWLIAIE